MVKLDDGKNLTVVNLPVMVAKKTQKQQTAIDISRYRREGGALADRKDPFVKVDSKRKTLGVRSSESCNMISARTPTSKKRYSINVFFHGAAKEGR